MLGFNIRIYDYLVMLLFLLFFLSIDFGFEHPTYLRKFKNELITDTSENHILCGWIY